RWAVSEEKLRRRDQRMDRPPRWGSILASSSGLLEPPKKTAGFARNPAALNSSTISMLGFHLNTLNHAGGTSAGVIHLNLLAGAERSGYDFARAVNDACRRPKSEAH